MKKRNLKYLVVEGYVDSRNDGDRHFISGRRLIELYNVNPSECLIIKKDEFDLSLKHRNLTILTPKYNGDYTL